MEIYHFGQRSSSQITVAKGVYNHKVLLFSNPETVQIIQPLLSLSLELPLYCLQSVILHNWVPIKRICTDGSSVEICTLPTYLSNHRFVTFVLSYVSALGKYLLMTLNLNVKSHLNFVSQKQKGDIMSKKYILR